MVITMNNHILEYYRYKLDVVMDDLADELGECEERRVLDHCTDCIEEFRKFN